MSGGYANPSQYAIQYSGTEPFSDPYNITIAFWYVNFAQFEIDRTTANRIVCLGANTLVRAYSDDDFDPGHSAVASVSLDSDTWHHAAAVWSASNARKAYSNGGTLLGGAEATDTADTGLSLTAAEINLIVDATGGIADIGVWNTALTDQEVAFLANGGRPHQLTSKVSNLVFYIPNRRTLIENVSGFTGDVTLDDQTGRFSPYSGGISAYYPAEYSQSLPICPAHKE